MPYLAENAIIIAGHAVPFHLCNPAWKECCLISMVRERKSARIDIGLLFMTYAHKLLISIALWADYCINCLYYITAVTWGSNHKGSDYSLRLCICIDATF